MLTMRDIATHVGVSVSTVSLVLNDRDGGRVRADVAQRIRQVADELGYVPNLLARGLKTRQTRTIGLLSDRVASIPFGGQMLAGAQVAAAEEGFLLMLIDTAGNHELDSPAVKALLQRNIEGFIVAAEFHRDVDLPLVPASVPTVVLNGRPRNGDSTVDWVVPDEVGGAFAATQYLIQAGHRRIAFCNVSSSEFVARSLRLAGYEAALSESGIPVDPSLIVEAAEPSAAAGRLPALEILQRSDRPTAVFCFSDQIAFGFYQAAHQLGLQIPDDLSIVGFDNRQYVADSLLPGLTTIQLPHREMGAWAAKQAIARTRAGSDQAPAHRLMPCPVIERDSVGPATAHIGRGGSMP
ncbi:LacI family DNA-binding transcriptional regulator [Arthrobacter sp. NPDC058192]|uniref:LacI family DNA-binding transcriptional regulator n=1 Tax=Arthrobacter sp. NPDC058192 TaxID=3346372 RepID=UPI0036F03801